MRVPVPTALHVAETWSMAVTEKYIETKCNGDEVSKEYVWSNMYGSSEE